MKISQECNVSFFIIECPIHVIMFKSENCYWYLYIVNINTKASDCVSAMKKTIIYMNHYNLLKTKENMFNYFVILLNLFLN